MDHSKVVTLNMFHVDFMRTCMRQSDIDECMATSGRDAGDVLKQGLDISLWSRAILNEMRDPCCAFGVANQEGVGVPWLLATDNFDSVSFNLATVSKLYIDIMLDSFVYLENYVDATNEKSIKWLKWCGFTIEEPKPYGLQKLPFCKFWIKREGGENV